MSKVDKKGIQDRPVENTNMPGWTLGELQHILGFKWGTALRKEEKGWGGCVLGEVAGTSESLKGESTPACIRVVTAVVNTRATQH